MSSPRIEYTWLTRNQRVNGHRVLTCCVLREVFAVTSTSTIISIFHTLRDRKEKTLSSRQIILSKAGPIADTLLLKSINDAISPGRNYVNFGYPAEILIGCFSPISFAEAS